MRAADVTAGFRCGKAARRHYFARHALPNDEAGVGRAYVLRRSDDDDEALPPVLGFYTLSMAVVTPRLTRPASYLDTHAVSRGATAPPLMLIALFANG